METINPLIQRFIDSGAIIDDPSSLYIDSEVSIAPGARIGPNVQLRGRTRIAAGAVIEGSAFIKDCEVGPRALLKFCVRCEDSKIGAGAQVGPFAHLRPGSVLEDEAHVGNFVETKKAVLESGVKANHLTYLGDCRIGSGTNIGAGTITCNYDGYEKHQTVIGRNVFIGSHTALVAPVEVEDGAFVGAGSVITKTVSKDSLALTRAPLTEKPGWARRYHEARRRKKEQNG